MVTTRFFLLCKPILFHACAICNISALWVTQYGIIYNYALQGVVDLVIWYTGPPGVYTQNLIDIDPTYDRDET